MTLKQLDAIWMANYAPPTADLFILGPVKPGDGWPQKPKPKDEGDQK